MAPMALAVWFRGEADRGTNNGAWIAPVRSAVVDPHVCRSNRMFTVSPARNPPPVTVTGVSGELADGDRWIKAEPVDAWDEEATADIVAVVRSRRIARSRRLSAVVIAIS